MKALPLNVKSTDELPFNLREEPGYIGVLTRNQEEGALLNGARVIKIRGEEDETHKPGDRATVLGSIPATELTDNPPDVKYVYFVEWDVSPGFAVGIQDTAIREINESPT